MINYYIRITLCHVNTPLAIGILSILLIITFALGLSV